jgi:hypothetical protein
MQVNMIYEIGSNATILKQSPEMIKKTGNTKLLLFAQPHPDLAGNDFDRFAEERLE